MIAFFFCVQKENGDKMIARKKPLEVFAIRYNDLIDIESFLNLLNRNKKEKAQYNEENGNIYIQKERGKIELSKGNWIIYEKNTDKCFWAIDKNIFFKSYEYIPNTNMMFKKRIYDVEYVFFKNLTNKDIKEVLEFYYMNSKKIYISDEEIENIKREGYILIETLEGVEKIYPGEYLIRGLEGEYYPVKKINFEKVYDIIN